MKYLAILACLILTACGEAIPHDRVTVRSYTDYNGVPTPHPESLGFTYLSDGRSAKYDAPGWNCLLNVVLATDADDDRLVRVIVHELGQVLVLSDGAWPEAMDATVALDATVAKAAALAAVAADLPQRITKNVALAGFTFFMRDSTTHTAATGLTVTAKRSLDGAALGACANAVAEIGNGLYKIDLAAGDLNGNVVALRFTAAGADDCVITLATQPT